MIEDKDFVMRLISKIGAILRLIIRGQTERIDEMEIEDALADLVGLPTTVLLGMTADSIAQLLLKIPSEDRLGMAGILLIMKGKLAKNDTFIDAGRKVIADVNLATLPTEIRDQLETLLND